MALLKPDSNGLLAQVADPGELERWLRLSLSARARRLVALCVAALLALAAVVTVEASSRAVAAGGEYQRQLGQLHGELATATASGYADGDLASIRQAEGQLESRSEPVWVGDRAVFYHSQAAGAVQLRSELRGIEAVVLEQGREQASSAIAGVSAKLDSARQQGTDDQDLTPIQTDLDRDVQAQHGASSLREYRAVRVEADRLAARADELLQAMAAETATIQHAADDLRAQTQGSVDALAKVGKDAIASVRNDAIVATWLKVAGFEKPYRTAERSAAQLGTGDVAQTAFAAAGAQRYAQLVHAALLSAMPPKVIVLSIEGQELWAYEGGKLVQDTLITSGRPPALATDVGPMKVLRKDSPWKMHSPWPKSSSYWYPDTTVQMVIWFTNTGEGLHDAYWQTTAYGPGSQYGPSASHGCVHVAYDVERWLYNWSDVGTPVIVIPGDGTPLASQLAQQTTDDAGNPLTGPKGA